MRHRWHRAFTLLELMTVIAIIFVLAGVMMVAAAGIRNRPRIERTHVILDVLVTGCERYWTACHDYPYTTAAAVGLPDSIENTNVAYVYLLSGPRQPEPMVSVEGCWFEAMTGNPTGPDGRMLFRVVDGFGNVIQVERPLQSNDVDTYVRLISAGPDEDLATTEDNLERYVRR